MRRPLFWVALLLVIIAAARLETGGFDTAPADAVRAQSLEGGEVTVVGQVYQKDDKTIYLRDVSVQRQISGELSSEAESETGFSRQTISFEYNIICNLSETQGVALGSYVTLEGRFMPISPSTNPGEFDAAAYYRTVGVSGRLTRARLLKRGEGYWRFRESLYNLRLRLERRLYQALPESQAGVLCALLLGDKGGLEDRVEELYRRSGILHILSISSLHITILGMSLYRLLRRLRVPVWAAALTGSVFLLFYGMLTGFSVSACRAIGMYLIRMLGEVLGRTYDMLTALGVMAAVMVLRNPWYLHHSGFLLSFSSVLGVGVLSPALSAALGQNKKHTLSNKRTEKLWGKIIDGLIGSITASLSVVLATLPVQLWCYYEVPVYSVFLNLLVLPFMKPLMLAGIAVLLFPGFRLPGAFVNLILAWYERLCELCGRLPFSTWNPGCPKVWQIAVYFCVLAAVLLICEREKLMLRRPGESRDVCGKRRRVICREMKAAMVGALLFCGVLMLGRGAPGENRVTVLDVGQGDCILVQAVSGETYLFDCGSTSRTDVGEYVLLPFLKYSGIRALDAVFVSHPDRDHVSGILDLLEMGEESGVGVKQLVLPDLSGPARTELTELTDAAEAGRNTPIPVRYISAGDTFSCPGARFTCLHPASGWGAADSNTGSECFYVEFLDGKKGKDFVVGSLLLTGDVEGEGETALLEELARRDIGPVEVLKVAHHGSRGTTSRELLEQIGPALAVISCGRNNGYGHPHPELMERLEGTGSVILRTDESGAVTVRFRKDAVLAEGFLGRK